MKVIVRKLIVSIVALAVVFAAIQLLKTDHRAEKDGQITIIIESEEGLIVFEDELDFFKDDSFFDIIFRNFELTCANQLYQNDTSCSYSFSIMGLSNKVLLGIKNDDFEIITDFNQTFIQIEIEGSLGFYPSTQGIDHLKIEDGSRIKLVVKRVSFNG